MTQVLLSGKCMVPSSLSRHNKDLEQRTLKPSARHSSRCVTALGSWTNRVIALRQISVTALFYLEDSRRIHPRRREERGGMSQHAGVEWGGGAMERERKRAYAPGERERLAPPFTCFLPPGPALCKLGLVRSAVLPEVLTPVLRPFFDLPLFYFSRLFPSLSFSHHTLDSFSLF